MQDLRRWVRRWLGLLALATMQVCAAQSGAPDVHFTVATPLGTQTLRLLPADDVLHLMVTLESKELAGVELKHSASGTTLKDRGKDVEYFPRELTFRFTVGSKTKLLGDSPIDTEFDGTTQEFLDTLHFRLKIFHGLQETVLEPEWQKIVGVPVEMPYNERIYRVRFKLPKHVPATERMMLEVIDSEAERVAKFAVDLL